MERTIDEVREYLVDSYASAQARGAACEPGTGPNVTGAVVYSLHYHPVYMTILYDGRDFYGMPARGAGGYELLGD